MYCACKTNKGIKKTPRKLNQGKSTSVTHLFCVILYNKAYQIRNDYLSEIAQKRLRDSYLTNF